MPFYVCKMSTTGHNLKVRSGNIQVHLVIRSILVSEPTHSLTRSRATYLGLIVKLYVERGQSVLKILE